MIWLNLQTEASRSSDPMGPPAPLSEGPPQQPAQGAGQCSRLGLGQHGSHPLTAAPMASSPPGHCTGAARLKVCTVHISITTETFIYVFFFYMYIFIYTVCLCVFRFADTEVRSVAVSWIEKSSDDELTDYLPQLVQVEYNIFIL